jgi:hypothetical protein
MLAVLSLMLLPPWRAHGQVSGLNSVPGHNLLVGAGGQIYMAVGTDGSMAIGTSTPGVGYDGVSLGTSGSVNGVGVLNIDSTGTVELNLNTINLGTTTPLTWNIGGYVAPATLSIQRPSQWSGPYIGFYTTSKAEYYYNTQADSAIVPGGEFFIPYLLYMNQQGQVDPRWEVYVNTVDAVHGMSIGVPAALNTAPVGNYGTMIVGGAVGIGTSSVPVGTTNISTYMMYVQGPAIMYGGAYERPKSSQFPSVDVHEARARSSSHDHAVGVPHIVDD